VSGTDPHKENSVHINTDVGENYITDNKTEQHVM